MKSVWKLPRGNQVEKSALTLEIVNELVTSFALVLVAALVLLMVFRGEERCGNLLGGSTGLFRAVTNSSSFIRVGAGLCR